MMQRAFSMALPLALGLHVGLSAIGITWGLPSRNSDRFLFSDGNGWTADKIQGIGGAGANLALQAASTGADVDINPLDAAVGAEPVILNAVPADIAGILLRYRLYTFQPDEMITMRALAGMNPRRLNLDPRLYQYGGLFIYPVGALIAAGGMVGLLDVRRDVAYYLDYPDKFGRFYVVARLYSAVWGLLGVWLAYAIALAIAHEWGGPLDAMPNASGDLRRYSAFAAAGLATVLFALLPVVVCMSHEAKPHLAGAVLMLAAVWLGIRHVQQDGRPIESAPLTYHGDRPADPAAGIRQSGGRASSARYFWLLCVCCGAAVGMVLSAVPILILIPQLALMRSASAEGRNAGRTIVARILPGGAAALAVYLATNPYIVINSFTNREVLRSNFGNSLAMYEVARIGEGLVRVLQLTVEGATLPVAVLGTIGFLVALARGNRAATVLAVPAAVLFLQFVLLGAGKPGEYGRFGVFTNAALAIATACLIAAPWRSRTSLSVLAAVIVIGCAGRGAAAYAHGFWLDACGRGSRLACAVEIAQFVEANSPVTEPGAPVQSTPSSATANEYKRPTVVLLAEPAPYSCPPMDFRGIRCILLRSPDQFPLDTAAPQLLIRFADHWPRNRDTGRGLPAWLWPHETPISWANKPFILRLNP